MAKSVQSEMSSDAFFGGEEPALQGEVLETVESDDSPGVQGDEPLPGPEPSEAETEAGEGSRPEGVAPEAPAETPPGVDDPTQQRPRSSWKAIRKLEEQLGALATERESWTKSQQELAELRAWRQQQEQTAQAQQQAYLAQQAAQQAEAARLAQTNGQHVPGVTRPYTQQELVQLRENDPIEYARLVAEHAQQQVFVAQQQQAQFATQMEVQHQVDTFRAKVPDYREALQFLEEREKGRWLALGWPEAKANEFVLLRAQQVIESCLNHGKNVGEVLYEVAKLEGWQTPVTTETDVAPSPVPTNSPDSASPRERVLASQNKSKIAKTSLGAVTGSPATKPTLTRADLLALTEEQMDRLDTERPGWEKEIEG